MNVLIEMRKLPFMRRGYLKSLKEIPLKLKTAVLIDRMSAKY
jgi:hypothetical protein